MTIDPRIAAAAIASPEGQRRVAEQTAANIRGAEIIRRGDELYDAATKEFGQAKVDKALGNFKSFDGLKVELAEAVFDAPEPHKVLFEIGKDPDLIDRLYKMPPSKMVAEVARMGERLSAASQKAASRDHGGGDSSSVDWHDPVETDMGEWLKSRERYLSDKRKAQRGGVRVY